MGVARGSNWEHKHNEVKQNSIFTGHSRVKYNVTELALNTNKQSEENF